MENLRSSSTSSLSPPLPQDKNCEVVSPRVHPYTFLDSRLALITPCSQFIHIRTPESEYLIEMQHIFIGRDDVSRHCYPFFQLAYSTRLLTSFLSYVACPSPKGDVEGDISCSLDPHRLDHMGDISQICRRTQPDARVSYISRSSPGGATTCSIRFPRSQCPKDHSHCCFSLVEHSLTSSPIRRILPADCTANSCTKITFMRSTSGWCLTWNPTAFA